MPLTTVSDCSNVNSYCAPLTSVVDDMEEADEEEEEEDEEDADETTDSEKDEDDSVAKGETSEIIPPVSDKATDELVDFVAHCSSLQSLANASVSPTCWLAHISRQSNRDHCSEAGLPLMGLDTE